MGSNEWGGRRLQSLSAERSVRSCGEHRVVWTAALSAGVGEIDRERQRLFAFHEAVHGVIRGRGDGGMLAGVLDQLVEYTRTHFAREEHWMRKCDYPGFDAHVHEHRHFTKQVRCLQQEQGAAPTMIEALKTLQLLSRWIPNHIERTDLALGEHLRAAGMGEI